MMRETNGSDSSEYTSIEIRDGDQQLVSSIQRKLWQKSPLPAQCCIFRVPISLRRHNKIVYVPNLVSIGPFHRGKRNLEKMERVKLWYLNCLLNRSPTAETSLDYFVNAIRGMESDIRECYAEQNSLGGDKFVEMMVVDGCFIIELFRKFKKAELRHEDDPVFNMSWMYSALANDLLLLENQLPWQVLECLWNLTMTHDEPNTYSLTDLALDFFSGSMLTMSPHRPQSNRRFKTKHLLDFLRSSLLSSFAHTKLKERPGKEITFRGCCFGNNLKLREPLGNEIPVLQESPGNEIPRVAQSNRSSHKNKVNFRRCCLCSSFAEPEPERPLGIVIPCVTELLQSGVKFKRGSENDMLNIKFNNGVMEIPPILIQDNAESLFRNLIAFEQCDPGCAHNITSYALLLDNLINSSKDVDFLCQKGIVLNYLSTEDIAGVFNRLYNDTGIRRFSYGKLCQKVNEHYQARCHRWQAILSRDYFNSPWSILSFLAAILILGFTFTQTLFSILSYKVSL